MKGPGTVLRCHGKGRKDRVTPLTAPTAALLKTWLQECPGGPDRPVFPSATGHPLSRDAVALLVTRHTTAATRDCPSLSTQTVSPHVLRHTCAMQLLHAGVDTSVIALWLGHESVETTQVYLHAALALKERVLARDVPTEHGAWPLPAPGRLAGLPGSALIMPSATGRSPPLKCEAGPVSA